MMIDWDHARSIVAKGANNWSETDKLYMRQLGWRYDEETKQVTVTGPSRATRPVTHSFQSLVELAERAINDSLVGKTRGAAITERQLAEAVVKALHDAVAPKIFDITIDEVRPATQEDVDSLVRLAGIEYEATREKFNAKFPELGEFSVRSEWYEAVKVWRESLERALKDLRERTEH